MLKTKDSAEITRISALSFCNAALEQAGHEPLQVQQEHLPHSRVLFGIGWEFFGGLAGIQVMLPDEFGGVGDGSRSEEAETQIDRA